MRYFVFYILLGCLSIEATTMEALSKELINPISMTWKLDNFIEVNKVAGDATNKESTSVVWNIQPVAPIMLGKSGYILMNRPALPIFFKQPVLTDTSQVTNVSGIGDLTLQSAIGKMPKTSWGSYMWGGGLGLTLPVANSEELGSGKYSAGPIVMLVGFSQNYTFGSVISHVWSYAGASDRVNVNQSIVQPLYYRQLGGGWQIGDNPQWMINWDDPTAEKYNIPVGIGIFKTLLIANSPWRLGVTPRYYFKSNPNFGNEWGVNFTITKVVKNPFK